MGRPSKLKPEFVAQAEKLCALGATDIELADFFEVSSRAIYRWKLDSEDFAEAVTTGKSKADDRVERSLFTRATGYEHEDIDIRVVNGEVVQTPIRKYYPPDTTACIFWLKNRRREQWRDKVETAVTDKDGNDVVQADPTETVRRLAFLLAKGAQSSG